MGIVTINGDDYRTEDDGLTHINVYSQGRTEIGRWLSNFEHTPLSLPEGEFMSLEAYYHYLKVQQSITLANQTTATLPAWTSTHLERLKRQHGKRAQDVGRDLKRRLSKFGVRIQNRPTDQFVAAFEAALRQKLERNPVQHARLQSVLEDGLPLVHYYVLPDGSAYYLKRFDWLCDRIRAVV